MHIVGIDGGGTKTVACLITDTGDVLARAVGESTNYRKDQESQLLSRILQLVQTLMAQAGIYQPRPDALSVCLSGLGQESSKQRVRMLLGDAFLSNWLVVDSDARAALQGAFAGEPGIILVAGTGSIAFARSARGEFMRCGGWGYLLGDEGSGFDIGRNGVAAALKALDGRGKPTRLKEKFESVFEVQQIDHAVPKIYAEWAQRGAMAKLAPVVFEAAEEGDAVARDILQRAAEALAELVAALYRRMQPEGETKLALMGNIFKQRKVLLPVMQAYWRNQGINVSVVEPRYPAEIGAALLALQTMGVPLDDKLLTRLDKTLKKVPIKE